jgi:RHS repeat-associated protein
MASGYTDAVVTAASTSYYTNLTMVTGYAKNASDQCVAFVAMVDGSGSMVTTFGSDGTGVVYLPGGDGVNTAATSVAAGYRAPLSSYSDSDDFYVAVTSSDTTHAMTLYELSSSGTSLDTLGGGGVMDTSSVTDWTNAGMLPKAVIGLDYSYYSSFTPSSSPNVVVALAYEATGTWALSGWGDSSVRVGTYAVGGGWIAIAGGSVDSGVLTPGSVSVVDGLSQLVGLSVGITTDDISVIYQSSTSSAYLLSLYCDGSLITTYSSTGVQYVSTASSGRIAFNHNSDDGVNIYADSSVAFGADGTNHGAADFYTSGSWTNYNGISFRPDLTAGDLGFTGFFDGWTSSMRVYARQDANWNVTSTVMLTLNDPTGTTSNAVERYDYTPYGQVTLLDGAFETKAYSERDWRQGFQGGFGDPVTGLVHFGAREYDPRQGRWKQQDPLGWPNGASRYEALGGNPFGSVDPSGMIVGGGSGNIATDLVYRFGTSTAETTDLVYMFGTSRGGVTNLAGSTTQPSTSPAATQPNRTDDGRQMLPGPWRTWKLVQQLSTGKWWPYETIPNSNITTPGATQTSYWVMTRKGHWIQVYVSSDNQYWCHGYTFGITIGGLTASPWAEYVEVILNDEYDETAVPVVGDIFIVYYPDGSVAHSGIVVGIDKNGNPIISDKPGSLPLRQQIPIDKMPDTGPGNAGYHGPVKFFHRKA